jgi:type VI secretion system secreted protein VgrG
MAKGSLSEIEFKIATALGEDLKFWRMDGREILGRPFVYELELLSKKNNITAEQVLGTKMTVDCYTQEEGSRYFNGFATSFAYVGQLGQMHRYQATLRSWLWFLTRTSDCQIFQQKKAPDIIKEIFRERGFSDFKESLSGTYRERQYCVQYRETDFNFVSRLMEEEGIYYYFTHEDGKHTLVLSDSANSHDPTPNHAELPYFPSEEKGIERHHIYAWRTAAEVQPGKYTLQEFDYLNPKANLESKSTSQRSHSYADLEMFDYPGFYVIASEGNDYVQRRLQELQAAYAEVDGAARARWLATGATFTLTDHTRSDQNKEYLVTAASYAAESEDFEPAGVPPDNPGFFVEFRGVLKSTQYRPSRRTPKPFVQGPQTAIVVGKSGEEIWTDEHGRVKVQFHWDRLGKKDENSSCWIRVASPWAGNAWGAIQLPRIGQEVVVNFLEGDPDQPIITGRVYNADNKPPYTLPDNKTQSGVKSRSSKEGDTTMFNELRFEDKKGEEEIYFHAEKNFTRVVENDDTLKVGLEKKDPGDQTITIHNNQSLVVGNSEANDGSQTVEVYKNRTASLKTGDDTLKVEQGSQTVEINTNRSTTIKTGDDTLKISAGLRTVEAAKSIELKVGASSIKIEPAKITIKSPEIAIEGTAKVDVKAAMTQVAGDATLILKGGIIKIN